MNRIDSFCGSPAHFSRRGFLTGVTAAGSWLGLSALASKLARAEEEAPKGAPAKSVIVLWLQGGPSQLETFDPHPGSKIGGPTKAIETSVKGVQLAEGFERVAELADRLAIVRSVTSKEGDHERATYNVKTGFRPDPTLVHPAIGAVVCHELEDDLDVPRYISILPSQWPGRGGYLGDQFDAFQIGDPVGRIPDLQSPVSDERFQRRVEALQSIVEPTFAQRRLKGIDENKTLHLKSVRSALKMMSSEHLAAFDATTAPEALRESYGDTAFGRGCLTAVRLIERGVRCVEVELGGWDTHVNNFEGVKTNLKTLDQAYAALIRDLEDKDLLKHTIVVCMGEFGRTPRINPTDGRDHWPHGFSLALAGGGIRGGVVHGETAADPKLAEDKPLDDVSDPVTVEDIHATMLSCLGVEFEKELMTPIKRPMIISQGKVIERLIEA